MEEAVEAARGALGPSARILAADRVRSGGVGGWFARERVEVTAEVDDAPGPLAGPSAAPAAEPAPAGSWPGETWNEPTTMADEDILAELLEVSRQAAPSSVLELAETVDDGAGMELGATRSTPAARSRWARVAAESTPAAGSRSFAAVLEEIVTASGGAAATRPPTLDLREAEPAGPTAPAPGEEPAVSRPSPAASRLQSLLEGAGITATPERSAPAPGPAPTPAPVVPLRPARPLPPAAHTPAPAPAPAPVPVPVPAPVVAAAAAPPARTDAGLAALAACGLPEHWLADLYTGDPVRALRDALTRLPAAPPLPTGAGTVIAVVGARRAAMAVAASLCAELELSEHDIVIASDRRTSAANLVVAHASRAADERRAWRWRRQPTVVVVDSAPEAFQDPWRDEMLAALEPTHCIAVAEASRKLEDLRLWTRSMVGLDGLALVDVGGTSSPASALGLGLPVVHLDGGPADADTWFALVEPWLRWWAAQR